MDVYGLAIKGDITIPSDNTHTMGGASNRMVNIYSVLFTGVATSSQWGDLAEKYRCEDKELPTGTVISVSSDSNYEVCKCNVDCDPAYIGVVSEKPGFLMNSNEQDGLITGLVGKIPVRIKGKLKKADFIVPTIDGYARAGKSGEELFKIGVALEASEEENKLVLCILK
jgi:hypothetical protein